MAKLPGPRESSESPHKHNKRGEKIKQPNLIVLGDKKYEWWKVHCTCGKHMENKTKKLKGK